jgi:flagellar biosynthesis component FlhA
LVFVLIIAFILAMLSVVAPLPFLVATTLAKFAIKFTYRLLLSQLTRQQALPTTEDC